MGPHYLLHVAAADESEIVAAWFYETLGTDDSGPDEMNFWREVGASLIQHAVVDAFAAL